MLPPRTALAAGGGSQCDWRVTYARTAILRPTSALARPRAPFRLLLTQAQASLASRAKGAAAGAVHTRVAGRTHRASPARPNGWAAVAAAKNVTRAGARARGSAVRISRDFLPTPSPLAQCYCTHLRIAWLTASRSHSCFSLPSASGKLCFLQTTTKPTILTAFLGYGTILIQVHLLRLLHGGIVGWGQFCRRRGEKGFAHTTARRPPPPAKRYRSHPCLCGFLRQFHYSRDGNKTSLTARTVFGCQQYESGLFRTQKADGIAGFSRGARGSKYATAPRDALLVLSPSRFAPRARHSSARVHGLPRPCEGTTARYSQHCPPQRARRPPSRSASRPLQAPSSWEVPSRLSSIGGCRTARPRAP